MNQHQESPHPMENTQVPEWEVPTTQKKARGFSMKSVSAFKGRGASLLHSDARVPAGEEASPNTMPGHQIGYVQSRPYATPSTEKSEIKNQGLTSRKLWTSLPYQRNRKLWIVGAVALVIILALAIGLGVGLSKRKSHQFLPLPSDSRTFTGDLTYYGPGLGACGVTSSGTDHIVSISHFLFDSQSQGSNPNANPLCGRKIRATRFDESVNGNRSIDLTVVDRCTGCQPTDLDVSPGAFSQLADQALGRVTVTWAWIS